MPASPALDDLATPVLWAGPDGRIRGCNFAFANWLGVSARRLSGQPLTLLGGDDGQFAALLARLPDQTEPLRARHVRLQTLNGTEYFGDLWLNRDDSGQVRVEAQPTEEFPGEDPATLLPMALSAALKGLAHELRNPLAGIKGAAQLLGRRLEVGEQTRDGQLLSLIQSEVQRLESLLERLLNPAPPRPLRPTNIHAVLERVRQLAEAEAGWAIKLVRDYDPSLPDVAGDDDRLIQALWNLVRNALESGAGTVSLRTRAERNVVIGDVAHRLVIRVEVGDDGRGVPDDLAERIFLPLVSGRAQGSGLGLPLAQQVAREHGGSLGYRSRAGHTVFTLLLPALAEEDSTHGA
ncbi:MAG: PAS domain-containing sensor histidine kinase [Gammaproteobacteria bacterium HGW-Gammaproteobacteria-7]|nr:MAG: PAS domain-containing sensor histidine kinase [Gammaproteobacteria bacterium HGW-Gammaproteobacteria-7]